MNMESRKRIGKFLEYYMDIVDPSANYSDEDFIEQSFEQLINEGLFTTKELQKELLSTANVLVPIDFLEYCASKNRNYRM